jgi:DAK2 domain fusion protein YloV
VIRAGADEARAAVAEPAEGTVLTVLADAARAAGEAASSAEATPAEVAAAAFREGAASVQRTRDILPALRAAGVVDAGGKGILLLLAALDAELSGAPVEVEVGPLGPVGEPDADAPEGDVGFKYEVQYLLDAPDDRVPVLRDRLGRLGDSLVVVGGGGTYKVHVHTNEPGQAVEEALDAGRPRQIAITDLADAVARCLSGQARAVQVERQRAGLVAVAEGRGLEEVFRSLGALVVRGGPGSNPSVADLLEAVETAPGPEVVLLPNHPNVVPAAERAAGESSKLVWVLATTSVPAGVSAATAFNPATNAEENLESMRWAADGCSAGEVTRAVRDAATPAGRVREGDWLGLVASEVVAVGDDAAAVAARLARHLVEPRHEILAVYVGADPSDDEAERVVEALRAEVPEREVEVHRGNQPAVAYLVGLE